MESEQRKEGTESNLAVEALGLLHKVELCFYNNAADAADWKQLRVTGEVEFLEDEESLEKAYQNRSFVDDMVGYSVRPLVRPMRIATGEAHFWTAADNLKESEIERLKF